MSVKTWKDEFYPTPADSTTPEEAIAHSLQKWIGLRRENLEKHKVKILEYAVVGEGRQHFEVIQPKDKVEINSDTCALCHHFHDDEDVLVDEEQDEWSHCTRCPLYKARDNRACDQCRGDEDDSPWGEFGHRFNRWGANPEPMIYWLEQTLEPSK